MHTMITSRLFIRRARVYTPYYSFHATSGCNIILVDHTVVLNVMSIVIIVLTLNKILSHQYISISVYRLLRMTKHTSINWNAAYNNCLSCPYTISRYYMARF